MPYVEILRRTSGHYVGASIARPRAVNDRPYTTTGKAERDLYGAPGRRPLHRVSVFLVHSAKCIVHSYGIAEGDDLD